MITDQPIAVPSDYSYVIEGQVTDRLNVFCGNANPVISSFEVVENEMKLRHEIKLTREEEPEVQVRNMMYHPAGGATDTPPLIMTTDDG